MIPPQTRLPPRPLEAARGEYTSPEGKSPYQLLGDWLYVVERFAEEVALDVDEIVDTEVEAEDKTSEAAKVVPEPVSTTGELIRFAGPPVPVSSDGKVVQPYDEDEDPMSQRKLNIAQTVKKDGLEKYKDQAGRLWTGLATYWIKRGAFDQATETFEAGIASVLTIRDFTQIFDAYAEFCEGLVSGLMAALAEEDVEDGDELEKELDLKMKEFEDLMDRRPFLVNDVLLRRNPNDVQEWEKRIALWGEDDEKVDFLTTIASKPYLNNFVYRWQQLIRKPSKPSTHVRRRRISTEST